MMGGSEAGEEIVSVPTSTPSGCQCDAPADQRRDVPLSLFLLWGMVALVLRRNHLKCDVAYGEE